MNVLDSFSLDGKVALLTGGAGKYGRQLVAALAEAGATTYIASRGIEALEAIAAEERERGFDVTALQYDQGDEKSILALRDEILDRSGRVDILVNNAAMRPSPGGWEIDAELFDKSMHVNATGLFCMIRAFAEPMRERKSGSIINIGSMMGMVGVEMANYNGTDMGKNPLPDYPFHKGGMINMTRFCASLLGGENIRVNCVSPGGFEEPSHPEPFVRQYSERTQLGRMANSTDLKGVVVFLASDASAYITGTNIPVDGGYTAK